MNSLATPHEYDITGLLAPGKNTISIRIDNRVIIPVGVNSHSISDHTQSNWNGITEISASGQRTGIISNINVYPDIQKKVAKLSSALRIPGIPVSAGSLRSGRTASIRKTDRQVR